MDEHRISPRHRTLKAGTIEFSGSRIDCLVRNVSETGAAIEVHSPIWFPDRFVLAVASDASARLCHIVWRDEKRMGVAFDD
jgi:hypothetical protein